MSDLVHTATERRAQSKTGVQRSATRPEPSDSRAASAAPIQPGDAVRQRERTEMQRLVSACSEGDRGALSQLYDRYAGLLLGLIRRIVRDPGHAEDVLQEAFLYAWRRAATYRPHRSSVSTWLVMIARSRAIDRVRKSQSQVRTVTQLQSETGSKVSPPEGVTAVLDGERRRRVRTALGKLPPNQRRVLDLVYYHGLTQAEISRRLDVPLGTVKTRSFLAMRKLRVALATEVESLI